MSSYEGMEGDIKEILQRTVRIETALWPDPKDKGILTKHDERLDSLEKFRNYLSGAWAVVSALFGAHLFKRGL